MPKGNDSQCPLGFHPQFRRPNYCKRCFREYSEHKAVKDGSNTSINSLYYDRNSFGSRDSLVSSSRIKDETEVLSRSKSDLSRNSSDDDERRRPLSWSSQDIRKVSDETRQLTKRSEFAKYGSSKTQDLGALSSLSEDDSKHKDNESSQNGVDDKSSSYSSYLFSKTKSSQSPKPPMHPNTQKEEGNSRIHGTSKAISENSMSNPADMLGKPPKSPLKSRSETKENHLDPNDDSKGDINKFIHSLQEVKCDSADASYVVKIRPKKSLKKSEVDLQAEVEKLQNENKELLKTTAEVKADKIRIESNLTELKTEKTRIEPNESVTKKTKFVDVKKQNEMAKLQSKVEELAEEMRKKNKELRDMKKEIDKRPLPKDIEKTMEELRSKLKTSETLCEELMDENDNYKKELKTLEDEMEELQDNFREDQADEYRDLKRELEQRAKDCRVLQFKLKKAERRSDILEKDKVGVEIKLKEVQLGEDDIGRSEHIKQLEKELTVAKDVSLKMHEEMEKMNEQLKLAEKDTKKLKEKVLDVPVKTTTKVSRSQVIGRQGSQENKDQLMRDLEDTLEREQDLKEQLRFAEEETKNLRKKLSRIEEENETLQMQLGKMSTKAKQSRNRSIERSGSSERSNSVERGSLSRQSSTEKPPPTLNGEDLDPTDMKIQLELNEQETTILRRKVEKLEAENMRLQSEMKDLLASSENRKTEAGIYPDSQNNVLAINRKNKKLELEISELKRQIADLEIEKNRSKTDFDNSKLTSSKYSTQGTNFDKNDAKFAQENKELRRNLDEFEQKYDQILDENKRLSLKAGKLPLKIPENMYIEKQVLDEKLKRTEKKLKDALDKIKTINLNSNILMGKMGESEDPTKQVSSGVKDLSPKSKDILAQIVNRTPKVPKELTPKLTLIQWVKELEQECATLIAALQEKESKFNSTTHSPQSKEIQDLRDKLQQEQERIEELTRQLKEERGANLDTKSQRKRPGSTDEKNEKFYEERIETLRNQLRDERQKAREVKMKIDDGTYVLGSQVKDSRSEILKLQKDLKSNEQIICGLERSLKEKEETLKISEKAERNLRNLLEKSEARLEEHKDCQSALEGQQRDMNKTWSLKLDEIKRELSETMKEKNKFENDMKESKFIKKNLETQLKEKQKQIEAMEGEKNSEQQQLQTLKKRNSELTIELNSSRDSLSSITREKDEESSKLWKKVDNLDREKGDLSIRMNTLETELKTEKKKRERIENENNVGQRGRISEREELKTKLSKAETENAKLKQQNEYSIEEYEDKIKNLEHDIKESVLEYNILQSKFTKLEESFATKEAEIRRLSCVDRDDGSLQREYDVLNQELKTLRDTYVNHQDNWIKEKLDLQMQINDLQSRSSIGNRDSMVVEKSRLRDIINDKNQQLESLKNERDNLNHQVAFLRREGEDLRKKIEDLDKLQELAEKHQGSSNVDTKAYESTIKDLRNRFSNLERLHKSESTKMKMRYDTKVKSLTEEINAVSQQMSKYRRERDTYKEMLNGAQRNIAELKGNTLSNHRTSRADNRTEAKEHITQIQDLQCSLNELEDKLADSRLETTKLRNSLVDQKTNYEIQLSELQTKLNEYEEDRLLGGGGRRVPGLRTRLELNWQKEREEQQRLIQETATLAKDLRKTLYEVERERDLERLESKRKIEQMRQTVDLDHHDTRSKVQELQRDLLELREAHAKLRQINEKLRREKDRTEVEREAMRSKFLGSSREQLNQQSKMERILDQIDHIKNIASAFSPEAGNRGGEILPVGQELFEVVSKMSKTGSELRMMLQMGDGLERMRRTPSFRRILSAESDDENGSVKSQTIDRRSFLSPAAREYRSQLYRKSQSLDHQMADSKGKIWVSTDAGSTSSIESALTDDPNRRSKIDLDRSFDRISSSSQTDELNKEEKRSSGFRSMLGKFNKSKSIEDTNTGDSIKDVGIKAMVPSMTGSGNSISSEGEKSTVKGKLKGMFKKTSSSKTQSEEKEPPSQSQETNSSKNSSVSKFGNSLRR